MFRTENKNAAAQLTGSTRRYKNERYRKGFALFSFWTKQFGIGDALGIQLLPLGRLLMGCRKEGGKPGD